jgi:hypothetical protein
MITTVLCTLLGIIILLLIVAVAIGTKITIVRKVAVEQPVSQVFNYLKEIKNQDEFSIWNRADPEMKKTFAGTDGQPGFIYAWDSSTNKSVGAGEQEIKTIETNRLVACELRFERPMKSVAEVWMEFSAPAENQTIVSWHFRSKVPYPMNLLKFYFAKMMGHDLETGLLNAKAILEKK